MSTAYLSSLPQPVRGIWHSHVRVRGCLAQWQAAARPRFLPGQRSETGPFSYGARPEISVRRRHAVARDTSEKRLSEDSLLAEDSLPSPVTPEQQERTGNMPVETEVGVHGDVVMESGNLQPTKDKKKKKIKKKAKEKEDEGGGDGHLKQSPVLTRRLILLRHAKSSWKDPDLPDKERPLNKRGRSAAADVAHKLVALGWVPDLILTSDAVRARETVAMMKAAEPCFEAKTSLLPSFYERAASDVPVHSTSGHIRDMVTELGKRKHKCIMCVGHNYGWQSAGSDFSQKPLTVKTANAVLLTSEGATWGEAFGNATFRGWHLVEIIAPDNDNEDSTA